MAQRSSAASTSSTKKTSKATEVPEKKTRAKKAEEPAKKTRAKKEEVPEKKTRAKAPTKTRAEKSSAEKDDKKVVVMFDPLADLDTELDAIEKHIGISEGVLDPSEKRMSTGNLMLDIILGGGITAGWYTNFGQEQSCKTTGAVTILASSMSYAVASRQYWDYESSGEPKYVSNIMKRNGINKPLTTIFGQRDDKTGTYITPPLIRYRTEGTAEKFFDMLAQLLRFLPSKKKLNGQWYYVYESKNREGKLDKAIAKKVAGKYDEKYFKATGLYRIPAPDGALQAIIVLDSYPAMLPEVLDVDDPNDALAAQARMFSAQLRRIKSRIKSRRVAVIGINILREVPMAMYGPKEKETCGTALKQYSDVRLRHTSRALSGVPYLSTAAKRDGEGMIIHEKSVEHSGKDSYRFIHVRADKNKLSRPFMETFLRLWITDAKKEAQGFCPVWDTFVYLMETGQCSGKMEKMLLKFKGNEAKKDIDWRTFKKMILLPRKDTQELYEAIGMKPVDLRKQCFAQMATGQGIDLFNAMLSLETKEDDEEAQIEE